jgi:Sel1 repeat
MGKQHYRIVGDRLIPEEDYQREQNAGGDRLLQILNLDFPVAPRWRMLIGGLTAVITFFYCQNHDLSPPIAFAITAGLVMTLFMHQVVLVSACVAYCQAQGADVMAYEYGIVLAVILSFTWVIVGGIFEARFGFNLAKLIVGVVTLGANYEGPPVSKGVRIFAGSTLGLLALLLAVMWFMTTSRSGDAPQANPPRSAADSTVLARPARALVLVKTSGNPESAPSATSNRIVFPVTVSAPGSVSTLPLANKTIPELKAAFAHDDLAAATELGVRYLNGEGVARDYAQAMHYFDIAGTRGDPRALTNIGWMAALGQGSPRDDAKAVHFFQNAASQGFPNAEDSLGFMYEHGRGVPKDLEMAKTWYTMAAAQGSSKAKENLQRLSQ